jgi:Malate/lactate dehydrogenases
VLYQRKKSSGFSAAKAIVDHMRDWIFGTESGNWVSMAVVSDGSYGIPEGLVFACPVTCKDFDYEIVKGINLTEFSKEMISIGIEELQDERDEATEEA